MKIIKNKYQKLVYILIMSLVTIITLYIFDQSIKISYNFKILLKLFLFGLSSFLYIFLFKENFIKKSYENKKINQISKNKHILGITIFSLILIFYFLTKDYINVPKIVEEFKNKYEITGNDIIIYGIYLSLVNSMLEELFFRGFIFLELKKIGYKKIGYIFSSFMFAIYHIANFKNWFNIYLFIIVLLALFIIGVIFNKLDSKNNTFFDSWYVHMCADIAIVIVGIIIM